VAAETSFTPIETRLSDREILLHVLTHVEEMHEGLIRIADRLEALEAEWATYRPLVATFSNGGKPDMISAAQAFRQGRRMRRG